MTTKPQTKLTVVLFSDIVDFTSLASESQSSSIELLKEHKRDINDLLQKYNGKLLKNLGDGLLMSFNSCRDAVLLAIELQKMGKPYKLRISIHQGDILHEDGDIFGDGVNIASRLNKFSPIGGIVLSKNVSDNVGNEKDINSHSIGEYYLKGKKKPFRLFTISNNEINVNQKIIRKNIFSYNTKTISRTGKGLVAILVTDFPTILYVIISRILMIGSGMIYYLFYYFIISFLIKLFGLEPLIHDFFSKYALIQSVTINSIIGFIGFVRGYTKSGIDVDENNLDISYKFNDSILVKKYNGIYGFKFLFFGRNMDQAA